MPSSSPLLELYYIVLMDILVYYSKRKVGTLYMYSNTGSDIVSTSRILLFEYFSHAMQYGLVVPR